MRSVIDGARGAYRTGDSALRSALSACFAIPPPLYPSKIFIYLSVYLFATKRKRLVLLVASDIYPAIVLLCQGSDSSLFARDLCVKHSVAEA